MIVVYAIGAVGYDLSCDLCNLIFSCNQIYCCDCDLIVFSCYLLFYCNAVLTAIASGLVMISKSSLRSLS